MKIQTPGTMTLVVIAILWIDVLIIWKLGFWAFCGITLAGNTFNHWLRTRKGSGS